MEIRAGQRPPRSTPEDQTSLSFDRTSGKSAGKSSSTKPWRKNKNMMMKKGKKKWKGRVSVFFYTCRRSFQVQSCGQAMAPVMLLQRGGAPQCVIFLFISPLSYKGWRWERRKKKSASPTADGRDVPLKVTGEKRCTFK